MRKITPRNDTRPKVRLYVEQGLGAGQPVELSQGQSHYLGNVMRMTTGDEVALFNGQDGEWRARLTSLSKRNAAAECVKPCADQLDPPDLWLVFAPIKKARTDFIVEKATELGVRRIVPVQTDFTNSERIRQDRLQAHAVEAAEQSGGTFVPEVAELSKLARLLDAWPADRRIIFCDETQAGASSVLSALISEEDPKGPMSGPWAVLIGPEGGFSDTERARLHAMPQAHAISLGPRILRADTAAVAALTLWQTHFGDWTGS